MNSRLWRVGAIVVAVGGVAAGLATRAKAQAPRAPAATAAPAQARTPGPGEVASDPIQCWWKTDTTAVHLGEQFKLTLTCGVIETPRLTVVPDLKQLEPTTLMIAPFDVVRGVRHEDLQDPPRRYFQYDYFVRLVGEGYFDKDVDIPSVTVTYNIQSPGGETQGRDQRYALPPISMRILSLVPAKATDIRDASRDSFSDIESRRFQATAAFIAAGIAFAFAVVLAGFAIVTMVRKYRERMPAVVRPLPARAVLGGCLRAIGNVKSDVAREGWTPELAGRALAAFRVASAVAMDRPVAQPVVDRTVSGREGQLVLRKGLLRPRRALVSAATTEDTITRHLAQLNGSRPRAQAMLEELRHSLRVLNAARYNRSGNFDTTALDLTLEDGASTIRRLRLAKLWPARVASSVANSAAGLGELVWSRSRN